MQSTQGTVNGLVYTPPQDFFGTDLVAYTIRDNTGLVSAQATVTITVNPVNDAPVAVNDAFEVDEETSDNVLAVLTNDNGGPNENSDTLTITATGTTSNGGTVAISGSNLLYTPAASFVGDETFTYTIQDGGTLEATATVTVTVEPTVIPRARGDQATTAEDGAGVEIDVLANDRVTDGEVALLVSVGSASFGTVSVDDKGTTETSDDTVNYVPSADFNGTDTFTYVMNDTNGTGLDSTGTVTVTVTNVNDPPIIVNDTASTQEDTPVTIAVSTLLANDSPGVGEGPSSQNPQTLSIASLVINSGDGLLDFTSDNTGIIYTPPTDFNGTKEFTYFAQDDDGAGATGTVTVTITAVNDAPTAGNDSASTNEDLAISIPVSNLLSNDSAGPADESAQTLSITAVTSPTSNGTAVLSGGNVTYTPDANFNGTDTVEYTLSDGDLTTTGTVTITVNAVNDAPMAGADAASGFNQIPLSISVADLLANDSAGPENESGQTLSITGVTNTNPAEGTAVLNNDGTITYTADPDFAGNTSFQYTLSDGVGGTATGVVNVTIEAFQPSVISGVVWVDETSDSVVDDAERFLGGVPVTLTGNALGQEITPVTMMTLADGSYSFGTLAPGDYTVSYQTPAYFMDGSDVPGALGDSDSVENQFTVNIAQPGGQDASGYNFAVLGLELNVASTIDRLASSYVMLNPDLLLNGAYFAVGSDNSLLWGANLDGFDGNVFAEAVMGPDNSVLLSRIDSAGNIFTARLEKGDFVKMNKDGVTIIRILGAENDFNWQQVDLQAPPYTAANYLDAIDEVYRQEGF
ncbi:MAG: Ig-like domain-containing protein [Planctomycetota bacterium]